MLHVEVEAFAVAVELRRRPGLRGQPVVVGSHAGRQARGGVASASAEARAYGVRAGMPLRTAARRCPQATFLPVDLPACWAAARELARVLRSVPGVWEIAGWDEAFLDCRADDPRAVAAAIRARLAERTGLACSVGIGANRLQAKVASALARPGGIVELDAASWPSSVGQLPTDVLPGVGAHRRRLLREHGIERVADLAAADEHLLAARRLHRKIRVERERSLDLDHVNRVDLATICTTDLACQRNHIAIDRVAVNRDQDSSRLDRRIVTVRHDALGLYHCVISTPHLRWHRPRWKCPSRTTPRASQKRAASTRLRADLAFIARPRHARWDPFGLLAVRSMLLERLGSLGPVEEHHFQVNADAGVNLIVKLPGQRMDLDPILVAAHYDGPLGSPGDAGWPGRLCGRCGWWPSTQRSGAWWAVACSPASCVSSSNSCV